MAASAREIYEAGRAARGAERAALKRRADRVATARLVLAAAALGLLGVVVWAHPGAWAPGALGAVLVAFVALVLVHARVHDAIERASAALAFHERGLSRLDHAWDKLPATSARFSTPEHPFAVDLDVFGRASLMQLTDVSETRIGEERLAALLSLPEPGPWPEAFLSRQAAVRDLAPRVAFREALSTAGGVAAEDKPDPSPLLAWAEEASPSPPGLRWVAVAVPAGVCFAILAASAAGAGDRVVLVMLVAALAVGLVTGARFGPMLAAVSTRESLVTRWRSMLRLIEREPFGAPLLLGLRGRLASPESGGRVASESLAALDRIVGFVNARNNEVFRFLIGPLLMWDLNCALALLRWRERHGRQVRGWLEGLGEVEALAGLGAFAFEHPDYAWPEAAPGARFEARSLGHPLLADARRVGNDVHLPHGGQALVVTGSNMSGKSTLLRAVGVNAVLAYAGAPVCARSLSIGPARITTSMRVVDSLEDGVSHFYAELRRLKMVLDRARQPNGPAVLFLLDEVLHGTNSRERVIGACALVRELLALGALGAVSTHDLGITALDRELADAGIGAVENVHFEEQVSGDTMTFDYVLRPGIVQSSNALRLMRAVGILAERG